MHWTQHDGVCAPGLAAPSAALKPCLRLQAALLLACFLADLIDRNNGKPALIVSRWEMTRNYAALGDAETSSVRARVRE